MKDLLFVYNPHSGKGQINLHLADIINILTKGGYDVVAHPTQFRNDAYELVKARGREFDLVLVSGGDGTVNEVIKGIMDGGHHTPVGTIPAGTMNDFCSSLGIPKNMVEAAKVIISGSPEYVDIGAFNQKFFTYVAAFGAFTKVSYETDQQLKNALGTLAYFLEAIRTMDYTQNYRLTIECNGQSVTDDFLFGMVANSLSVGGIKGLAGNDICMSDGIFEGLFIKHTNNLIEFQQMFNALLKRDFNSPYFCYFRSSDFRFVSDGTIPWTLDGEYGGNDAEISLCAMHDVLKVIVNKDNAIGLKK